MRSQRTLSKTLTVPEKLGWRDYFQITTTVLMVILGSYILWQTIFVRWAIPSFIFSIVLLLFGIHRIRMVWIYFTQKGKHHGSRT